MMIQWELIQYYYNIDTNWIKMVGKMMAKCGQIYVVLEMYWNIFGTSFEIHMKLWTSCQSAWNILWLYDEHMMNIVWNLYEHCCDMWQPGQWLRHCHMPDLHNWVDDHWLASSSSTMAAMLKVPYPNPDGHFFYMASTAVPPQDLDGDDDEDDFVPGQSPTFSVPQRYHWTFFKILISIWIWFEAIGIIWNSFGYELNIYMNIWYYDRLHYTIFIVWLYIIYHYMIIYDHFLYEIWYKFDMNLFFLSTLFGHGMDMGMTWVWFWFEWSLTEIMDDEIMVEMMRELGLLKPGAHEQQHVALVKFPQLPFPRQARILPLAWKMYWKMY